MGATFSRVKSWISLENLTNEDLNAELDNVLNNLDPSGVDDYSSSVAQMQLQTDPGAQGSESQATSLAGELERIRFVLDRIIGETYWYDAPNISLADAKSSIDQVVLIPNNRIISGAVRSASNNFPAFLEPGVSTTTVTLKAATTDFVVSIEGTQYTEDADVAASSLLTAPSTNNTALVNNADFSDQEWTSRVGEFGARPLDYDTAGSEITSLDGKFAGFKINDGSTDEYFIAQIDNTNSQLINARRGFFLTGVDTPVNRVNIANNDTITLMKLTWLYYTTAGGLVPVYTNPTYGQRPSSPAAGDYHFNQVTDKWETFSSGVWADANATLVGVCIQDDTNCVAARPFDYFDFYNELNTVSLEIKSTTVARMSELGGRISVAGNEYQYNYGQLEWDITADRDSGVSESASTYYTLYVKDTGQEVISDVYPYFRPDLNGWYHPFAPWRSVGEIFNDSSSDITALSDHTSSTERHKIGQGNGHGSTNGAVRRFSVIIDELGTSVSLAQSATLGDSFTIRVPDKYHVLYKDDASVSTDFGMSRNGTELNTGIGSVANADEIISHSEAGAGASGLNSFSGYLLAGDIIRTQTDGGPDDTASNPTRSFLQIVRLK
jgi:hypothetical protein